MPGGSRWRGRGLRSCMSGGGTWCGRAARSRTPGDGAWCGRAARSRAPGGGGWHGLRSSTSGCIPRPRSRAPGGGAWRCLRGRSPAGHRPRGCDPRRRGLGGWCLGLAGGRSPVRRGGSGRRRGPVAPQVAQLLGVAALQAPRAMPLVLTTESITLRTMITRRTPIAHPRDFTPAEQ